MGFITDILRSILWAAVSGCLQLLDFSYEIIKDIIEVDVFNSNETVWGWFSIMIVSFTAMFILFRIVKNFILDALDQTRDVPRINVPNLFLRLIGITLVIGLAPLFLKAISAFVTDLIKNIEIFLGTQSKDISDVVCMAGGLADGCPLFSSFDINQKEAGTYVFMANSLDFIILGLGAVACAVILLLVGVQIGTRIVSMVMKLVISPWAFSSIVDEKPETFSTWCKLFLADYFANFIQIFLVNAGMAIVVGLTFNDNTIAKLIAMIGALFAILNAPSGIGQLIGADIGANQALQSLQSSMALLSIGRSVGSIGANMAAFSTYAVGRLAGGTARRNISKDGSINNGSNSGGFGSAGGGSPMSFMSGDSGTIENINGSANVSNVASGGVSSLNNAVGFNSNDGRLSKATYTANGTHRTPARVMGDSLNKNGFGRAFNRVNSSLYKTAAMRLNRKDDMKGKPHGNSFVNNLMNENFNDNQS